MICTTAPPRQVCSAERLHGIALEAFRLGNRGRLELCQILWALYESKQYQELGFPDIVSYARRFFRFEKTEAYEAVRVARAVDGLPRCAAAFCDGAIDWSALKSITRIASQETEEEWLEFAAKHNNAELRAEVSDALKKNRDRPRGDRYGLPNIEVNLVLKLTRSEHEKVRAALESIAPEVSDALGGGEVDAKAMILYIAERILATEPGEAMKAGKGVLKGRRRRRESPHMVLYHLCAGCRRARMATDEGMVEVSPEEVERVEGEAQREGIDIDPPTPPRLRKKVLLRDGCVCANPHCSNRADQTHHIVFRSRGGKTALFNEVSLCSRCHALAHAGLLRVTGDADRGVEFSACAERMRVDLGAEEESGAELPVIKVYSARAENSAREESSPGKEKDWSYLARALVRLGWRKKEALERVNHAIERLRGKRVEITEEEILRAALICS